MSERGKWNAATISTGTSLSSAIDLTRAYEYLDIQIPMMDECKLYLQVSETLGGTYYDLGKDTTTDLDTFNRADVWKLGSWRYIKVASSNSQSSDRGIRVRGVS